MRWPSEDRVWYSGRVSAFDNEKQRYKVELEVGGTVSESLENLKDRWVRGGLGAGREAETFGDKLVQVLSWNMRCPKTDGLNQVRSRQE